MFDPMVYREGPHVRVFWRSNRVFAPFYRLSRIRRFFHGRNDARLNHSLDRPVVGSSGREEGEERMTYLFWAGEEACA